MPEEFFAASDGDYFYVSTSQLPWAQAQYECLARKGHLAELDGTSESRNALINVLKEANATGRYWIGASDLEEFGHFKWFYSGNSISSFFWDDKGKPSNQEEAKELDQVIEQRYFTHPIIEPLPYLACNNFNLTHDIYMSLC